MFLTPETIGKIFGNSRAITSVHTRLLSKLEQKMNRWGPDQTIGDIFIEIVCQMTPSHLSRFLILNITFSIFLLLFEGDGRYVNNYNNAMEVLKKCLDQTAEFDEFLKV